MNLNDLLLGNNIDPKHVLVFRHRPPEPDLNKVLPWLAAERPEMFNAYQQTQREKLEKTMQKMMGYGYVASFIGHNPGQALFVGLYSIVSSKPLTHKEFWKVPAFIEMREKFGLRWWHTREPIRTSVLWFNLELTDFYAHWKGKLIVGWAPPERSWWRRAHRNEIPVTAVLEDNAFNSAMPKWDDKSLTWDELGVLPARWKSVLSQWRGIYYIFDISVNKGYVGSAYGANNILGRWENYAKSGHGGNRLLKKRNARNFHFTILQRVSPDMDVGDVIRLEATWKKRLHTRDPHGLNDN